MGAETLYSQTQPESPRIHMTSNNLASSPGPKGLLWPPEDTNRLAL